MDDCLGSFMVTLLDGRDRKAGVLLIEKCSASCLSAKCRDCDLEVTSTVLLAILLFRWSNSTIYVEPRGIWLLLSNSKLPFSLKTSRPMIKYNIIIAAIVSLERISIRKIKVELDVGTISVRSKTVYERAPSREKLSTKPEKDYASALLVVFASVLGRSTHCHTAIHGSLLRCVDEKEGHSRNEYNGSNDTNILLLQLSQIFSIILVEDN